MSNREIEGLENLARLERMEAERIANIGNGLGPAPQFIPLALNEGYVLRAIVDIEFHEVTCTPSGIPNKLKAGVDYIVDGIRYAGLGLPSYALSLAGERVGTMFEEQLAGLLVDGSLVLMKDFRLLAVERKASP